jgi:hypothetical protein
MADPRLFEFRKMVISRDHKIIAIVALFLGGFVGRAILQSTNAGVTLGIGAALRGIIAVSWFFVPGKTPQPKTEGAKPGGKEGA